HGQIVKEQTDLSLPAMPLSVSVRSHYREFDHIGKGVFKKTSSFKFECAIIKQSLHFVMLMPSMIAFGY
ncbi:hypothetical protein ACFFLZ_01550, partial [Photobacterium aphoticum]